MTLERDLARLHTDLAPIAARARDLPWASERCWSPSTHLGATNGLPAIDLHDLSVRLALQVVESCPVVRSGTGGVVLITGRGRHTGGRSKLREAVLAHLEEQRDAGALSFHAAGPGRVEVIYDAERVRRARPGMGLLFWLLVGLLLLGIAAALFGR